MNREPSIHIRYTRLAVALSEAGISNEELPYFINSIISHSKRDNLSHRNMIVDTKKMDKIAQKSLTSNASDVDLFNQLLFFIRKKNHHRVRSKYDKGSREYTIIQKASELAIEFCNEFKLTRKEGFTKYIEVFLLLNKGKFWLNNLVAKYEYYCSFYEAELLVNGDKNHLLTVDLMNLYDSEIMSVTGVTNDEKNIFDKANFVRSAEQCVELGVSAKVYMNAQFEGLGFIGGIPHTSQMYGDKAKSRVIKYMAKHEIRSKEIIKKQVDWSQILGGNNG